VPGQPANNQAGLRLLQNRQSVNDEMQLPTQLKHYCPNLGAKWPWLTVSGSARGHPTGFRQEDQNQRLFTLMNMLPFSPRYYYQHTQGYRPQRAQRAPIPVVLAAIGVLRAAKPKKRGMPVIGAFLSEALGSPGSCCQSAVPACWGSQKASPCGTFRWEGRLVNRLAST